MESLTEITIPAGEGAPATPAVAILPRGAERGVVVIHEIFGRQPEIDRAALRLAAAGYAAVAPDLFAARGKASASGRSGRATSRSMCSTRATRSSPTESPA